MKIGKITIGTILLGALCAGLLYSLPIKQVDAADLSRFEAGRIIDDSVFTNWRSMTAPQIQEFLNQKNSVCLKNFQSLSLHDDNGDGVVQDSSTEPYGPGTMTAAELIAEAAKIYRINPQVILATLQKEQGLVTRTDCPSWRYNTALGYGCPDSAPCDQAAFGFTRQIDYGTYHFRGYFDDTLASVPFSIGNHQIGYNPDPACGSSTVYIQNRATASLYSYTPYQPNAGALAAGFGEAHCGAYGNRNFFHYFNDWFGRSVGSPLVRVPGTHTVYLLTNDKKFAIPSGDILYAYGLQGEPIDEIGSTTLSNISDGGMLSTLFTVANDPTVYLADGAKRYGISSGSHCVNWGLMCDGSSVKKELGQEILHTLSNGGILQPLMKHAGSTFLMEEGKKREFLSARAIEQRGYGNTPATTIVNWTNAIRTFGYSLPEDGSFVKFGSSGAIYAYADSSFYAIPDFETFRNWYTTQTPSHYDTRSLYNTQPPTVAAELQNIVVLTNGNKFLIDGGSRVDLTQTGNSWPTGMAGDALQSLLARLPIRGSAATIMSFRQNDGAIYIVEAGKKRPLNSIRDYFDLGYGDIPAMQLRTSTLSLPTGHTVFAEGSAFKSSGSDAIYMITRNSKIFALTSVGQIPAFVINPAIPLLNSADASQFNYIGILKSLVVNDSNQYYVISQKGKLSLTSSDISTWGLPTADAINLSNTLLDRVPTRSSSGVTFLASPSGTIYKGEGGTGRPIGSFETYRALGGNDSNTNSVPQDIIDMIPLGTPYP